MHTEKMMHAIPAACGSLLVDMILTGPHIQHPGRTFCSVAVRATCCFLAVRYSFQRLVATAIATTPKPAVNTRARHRTTMAHPAQLGKSAGSGTGQGQQRSDQ